MVLLSLLISFFTFADSNPTDEKVVGVFYLRPILGHVHQSSSRTSASLTTIQCSHPVKVIESSKVQIGQDWAYVEVAGKRGFILKEYLAEKKPQCFQSKYAKFFDSINLDLAELYYWGRLYDQYVVGETRVE
jgi:hypothetical protein